MVSFLGLRRTYYSTLLLFLEDGDGVGLRLLRRLAACIVWVADWLLLYLVFIVT